MERLVNKFGYYTVEAYVEAPGQPGCVLPEAGTCRLLATPARWSYNAPGLKVAAATGAVAGFLVFESVPAEPGRHGHRLSLNGIDAPWEFVPRGNRRGLPTRDPTPGPDPGPGAGRLPGGRRRRPAAGTPPRAASPAARESELTQYRLTQYRLTLCPKAALLYLTGQEDCHARNRPWR